MLNLPDEKESLSLLYREIEKRNYIITTAELVELGYHKLKIAELVTDHHLCKIGHGLYTIPDEAYDPIFYLTKVSKIWNGPDRDYDKKGECGSCL